MNVGIRTIIMTVLMTILIMINTTSAYQEEGIWYQGNGGDTLTIGGKSLVDFGSAKKVNHAYIKAGCWGGETMGGYIEYLDGSVWKIIYSFSDANCGYDIIFPEVITTSIRLSMTNGGGSDNVISWYDHGSEGWKVYATSFETEPDWCKAGTKITASGQGGQGSFEIKGITTHNGVTVCEAEYIHDQGSVIQYFNKKGDYMVMVYKDKDGNVIQEVYISTPTPKFRIGPTVRIRPLNDEISKDQDGLVELYMDNPTLNDVMLNVDIRIGAPSGVHIYGEGFGKDSVADTVYGKFNIPPGESKTIEITIKTDKIEDFSAQFSGMYWPGDNKDAYQPISLTHPFKAISQTPTIVPTTPTETPERFRVGPTVRIRPLNDVISKDQDGLVELYMNNPSLNDIPLNVDIRISVPSGIHVYGQGFGEAGIAGMVYGKFELSPGNTKTINIQLRTENTGDFSAQFSGMYWPGNNKDAYQPISLTHPFKVIGPAVPTTPMPTVIPTISVPDTGSTFISDVDQDHGFYRVIDYTTHKPAPYVNNTLTINVGDTVQWINNATPDEPLTIMNKEGLWGNRSAYLRWNYQRFSYTFNGSGTYEVYIKEYPREQHQKIVVGIITVPTVSIPTTVPTVSIPTTVPTITETPITNKRATLQVTYNIDKSDNDVIITIKINNIGDDIARFVSLNTIIPSELSPILLSGAENRGGEIVWKGDIDIGKEHDIKISVKPIKADINLSVRVTYVKDSLTANKIMSTAAAEGVDVQSILITPGDLQVILLLIQITKELPGFGILMGMIGILTIYLIKR